MAFACIFVPDFPVQAVMRLDPELRGKAVVIFQGAPPLTRVLSANSLARELGVELEMTKLQAEACGPIEWRWRSASQEATAQAALLDCAWTISPRIEQGPKQAEDALPDTVVLDIAGCQKLFGSHKKIAGDLKRVAEGVGFEAQVAIAVNPEAAICAARGFSGTTVVPEGKESEILGQLSLASLSPPAELLETLRRWGVHTCAEFAALPEIAVIERLGQAGRRWQRLARGTEVRPLLVEEFPSEFEECMDLDFPVDLLESLLFVLNRLLEQLCLRLKMHVLATNELTVTLTLQPGDSRGKEPLQHIRKLRLPVPVKEAKFLLKLLQLDLQAHSPGAPVTKIHIVALPTRARTRQLGLFLPPSPEPEALEVTLARIENTVGEGRVGVPALVDSHRPGAFRQNRFMLREAQSESGRNEFPVHAALRIFRPPLPAKVELQEKRPAVVICEGARRAVLALAGPFRAKGGWWSESPWARDEWDVLIAALRPKYESPLAISKPTKEETALYRIYLDLRSNSWFVEGIYD
ncbi:MAG TPA: DNA polymerase Y family protein [Candidatus Saccharimonadales bacterium]|nr:DNA polymerase Y family protein [Candidatus Saccharimonadales bacterium]